MALFAMVLAAALLTAVAFRAAEEQRVALSTMLRVSTFGIAESALRESVDQVSPGALRLLPIGTPVALTSAYPDVAVSVVRTDSTIAWIVAAATVRRGRDVARRRLGMSVTFSPDTLARHVRVVPDRAWAEFF